MIVVLIKDLAIKLLREREHEGYRGMLLDPELLVARAQGVSAFLVT